MTVPDGIYSTYSEPEPGPEKEEEEKQTPAGLTSYHTDPKLTDAERRAEEEAEGSKGLRSDDSTGDDSSEDK